MPKTILRILFFDTIKLFVLSLLGLSGIFVVLLLMQAMQRIEGIGVTSLLNFVPALLFGYQGYLIPLALLIATSLAYGRFKADGEFLITSASAITPWKVLIPALLLGCAACIPAGWANFIAAPKAYVQRDSLKRKALADLLLHPPNGSRTLVFPELSLSYRDFKDGSYEGVVIHLKEESKGKSRLKATLSCSQAELRYDEQTGILRFIGAADAHFLSFNQEGQLEGSPSHLQIKSLAHKIPFGSKSGRISFKADLPSELLVHVGKELQTLKALPVSNDKAESTKKHHKFESIGELLRRSLFSLAPLFFALLGAFAGLLVPGKNRLIPLGIGLVLSTGLFFGLSFFAIQLEVRHLVAFIPPFFLGASLVFLPLLFLLWKFFAQLHRPRFPVSFALIKNLNIAKLFYRKKQRGHPKKPQSSLSLSFFMKVLKPLGLKSFDLYFLQVSIITVFMAFFIMACLYVSIDFLYNLETFSRHTFGAIVRHYALSLLELVLVLAPPLVLLGGIFGLTQLMKEREILVLQVGGMRSIRILRSFWITALCITGLTFLVQEKLLPDMQADGRAGSSMNVKAERGKDVTLFDQAGQHWYIGSYDLQAGKAQLKNVEISFMNQEGTMTKRLRSPVLKFSQERWWGEQSVFELSQFKNPQSSFPEKTLEEGFVEGVDLEPADITNWKKQQQRSIQELMNLRKTFPHRKDLQLNLYRAFLYPFGCVLLLAFGAVVILRTKSQSLFLSTLFMLFIAFGSYALQFLLEHLALRDILSIEFAAFAPYVLLGAGALIGLLFFSD